MTQNKIKVVRNKRGQLVYFYGDCLWFGRISAKVAEAGLKDGSFIIWSDCRETETVSEVAK